MLSPIRVTPFFDEILSSYIIRSALASGTDPIGYTGAIWLDKRIWTHDIDRFMNIHELTKLSKRTGIDVHVLTSLTLYSKLGNAFQFQPKTLSSWDWIIPISSRNRSRVNGLHYCPECISEKPTYFRINWRIAWNVACEKHGHLLTIECPKCNTVISPHLINYLSTNLTICVKCHHKMNNVKTSVAASQVINLQKILNNALNNQLVNAPWGITNKIELFATFNALTAFFQKVRSYEPTAKKLFKALRTIKLNEQLPKNSKVQFLKQPLNERYFIMLNCASLFKMTVHEAVNIFHKSDVPPSLLKQNSSHYFSNSLNFIYNQLEPKTRKTTQKNKNSQPIKPRTQAEVDQLWDEVKCFL